MLEIFSTRELVSGIYFLFFFFCFIFVKTIKKATISLIKCVFCKAFVKIYCLIIAYAAILVYLLQQLDFWKWIYLKDIILWVLFVGIATCLKAGNKKLDENYFKNIVLVNIEVAAIMEFIISSFTFSIWGEFVLQAILIIICMFRAVTVNDEKLKPAEKFFDFIFYIIIFIVLGFTIKEIINSIGNIDFLDMAITFCIPLVFSIAFLPMAYFIGVYSKYQILFIRILHIRNKDKQENNKKRIAIFSACGLSYKKLCAFEKGYYEYIKDVKAMFDNEKFYDFVKEFKKTKKG